jgi:hypothetical protein
VVLARSIGGKALALPWTCVQRRWAGAAMTLRQGICHAMILLIASPATAAAAAIPMVSGTVVRIRRWPITPRPMPRKTSSTTVTDSETILAVARENRQDAIPRGRIDTSERGDVHGCTRP